MNRTDRGVLRHIVLRQSRASGKMILTLVAGRRPKVLNELAERIEAQIPEVDGVHLHLNTEIGNSIFQVTEDGIGSRCMAGTSTIEEELGGVRLNIGSGDFFQANPSVADLMVRDVVELVSDERDRPIVDLYCGVGAFTLALAKEHGWGIGIDVVASAVRRAQQNAQKNRISAEFVAGPVEERIADIAVRVAGAAPVVVMDPARRGVEPSVIDAVTELKPSRLIYVSCNATTLARDLVGFVAKGWAIEGMKAYDMFPQTAHLELVVDLRPAVRPQPARSGPRRRKVR
jgi:23S rRNA (uracil1939-C5)-methyltransferase